MKNIIEFLDKTRNILSSKIEFPAESFLGFDIAEPANNIYAVDGGSCIIVDGGNWLIAKLRIGHVKYQKKARTEKQQTDFNLGIVKSKENVKFDLSPKFDWEQFTIPNTKLDEMPNIIRSILEWNHTKKLVEKMSPGDIMLVDGSFVAFNSFHKKIISDTLELCKNRGVHIIGVCKTCRLEKEEKPLIGCLCKHDKQNNLKQWLYSEGETDVAKFHEKSKFCYRIQFDREYPTSEKLALIGKIAYYCRDPELLGYPYPLLSIDKIARIRDNEKDLTKHKVKALAKKLGKDFIEDDEKSTIMHDLLDERAYR